MNKSIIIIALLLFNFNTLFSQSEDFDFVALSNTLTISGTSTSLNSEIKKVGNNISWTQFKPNQEAYTINFTISGMSGNWSVQNSLGDKHYHLISGDQNSAFRLFNTDESEVLLTLSIDSNDGNQEQYVFNIESISY